MGHFFHTAVALALLGPPYKSTENLGPSAWISTQIQFGIPFPGVHRPSKTHLDPLSYMMSFMILSARDVYYTIWY